MIEQAASLLRYPFECCYFYFLALLGARKSEANRAEWAHVDWLQHSIWIAGKKTKKSKGWMPLPPVLEAALLQLYQQRLDDGLIFPGRTARTKGKIVSDRKKLFKKIAKLTAERYGKAVIIPRQTQYMRRFYATAVSRLTPDINTVRSLMRHTNLSTTSNYVMQVNEYAHEAVKFLGATLGADRAAIPAPNGPETPPAEVQAVRNGV